MNYLDLGLSAIRATQVGLRTAANNLSNAQTPGYHRQIVQLASQAPITQGSLQLGSGVTVTRIQRLVDSAIESAVLRNRSALADATARLNILNRLDSLMAAGTSTLASEVTRLFDSIEALAANPQETILQKQVLSAAQGITRELNNTLAEIQKLQLDVKRQIDQAVVQVTQLSTEITRLNQQIQSQIAQGREPNDLLDRRDGLLAQVADLVDVAPGAFQDDAAPIPGAGGSLLFGTGTVDLQVVTAPDGRIELYSQFWNGPVVPTGGKLAGLLDAHNHSLVGLRQELLSWFDGFRREFDQVQATGLGAGGGFDWLEAQRSVADPDVRLAALAPEVSIAAGDLYVTLTDKSTGQRTTHRITVDPAVHSLNDVAAMLNAVPGLYSTVQSGTNRLVISASAGYEFDFAGRLDQQPQAVSVTGAAAPTIGGIYTGATNVRWQIEALDAGTVGVTAPLRLAVKDSLSGAVLTTVDVGLGYEAGTSIALSNGVTLQLPPGTINTGDTWELSVIANPDQTGLVGGLGLRSFFTGSPGGPFGVHPDLLADSRELATSRTGLLGDSSNLQRLMLLRGTELERLNGETIENRLGTLVGLVGLDTQFARSETEQLQTIATRLSEDRDALSGVDPNEEMLTLMRLQQSFQAATRFISIVQSTIDDLLKMIA